MRPVSRLASILLAAVALAHLARLLFGAHVTIDDRVIPVWVSWVGFVVAGAVAILLWREARRKS